MWGIKLARFVKTGRFQKPDPRHIPAGDARGPSISSVSRNSYPIMSSDSGSTPSSKCKQWRLFSTRYHRSRLTGQEGSQLSERQLAAAKRGPTLRSQHQLRSVYFDSCMSNPPTCLAIHDLDEGP
jgi:hypothetical protein